MYKIITLKITLQSHLLEFCELIHIFSLNILYIHVYALDYLYREHYLKKLMQEDAKEFTVLDKP